MSTYVIGDLQGCYDEFSRLLEHIDFDQTKDRLWLVGDLVNRGPQSAAVMELVMSLDQAVTTVLGNHDLHLLALALRPTLKAKRKDTLADILESPARDDICHWLRRQKIFHFDQDFGVAMVHAGVAPEWSLDDCLRLSCEVEACLQDDQGVEPFLEHMYGDRPDRWDPGLSGYDRLRFITNCFTRVRYYTTGGAIDLHEKGALDEAPGGLLPWFKCSTRQTQHIPIVFGHWSTLRLNENEMSECQVYPLDTGAVWGGELTALRLEDRRFASIPSDQQASFD